MTNEQLARLVVAEFDRDGDISDEALKETWKAIEFTDLCQRITDLNDRAFEFFLSARERVRPSGITPVAAVETMPIVAYWPPLEPLVPDRVLPAWPIHVLPEWMSNHVVNMSDQLQVPVDLCAQLAVGALAAAAMGHGEVHIGPHWREPLNLYLATAMHSGAGKSPAEKAMTKPLREWEAKRMEMMRPRIIEAERRKAMKEKKAKVAEESAARGGDEQEAIRLWLDAASTEVPPMPRLLADDATPEALVQLLARHGGRMALLSTEADVLDMASGAYSDGRRPVNLSVYLKGWSGDAIIVDRKGSSAKAGDELRIDKPLLTVSITMQPTVIEWLRESGGQLEGRGLLARFMFALPKSLRGQRDRSKVLTVVADTSGPYADEFVALADSWASWATAAELHFDPDAEQLLISWLKDVEPSLGEGQPLAGIAEWATKCQSSVARLAGLFHLCAGATSGSIPIETVARAIEVGRYWLEHAEFLTVRAPDDSTVGDAEKMLAWIGRKRPETFTPRDVWLPMRRQFNQVVDIVPGLQLLSACGYLSLVEGEWETIGVPRSKVVCAVNPVVLACGEVPLTWRGVARAECTRALIEKKGTTTTSSSSFSSSLETVHSARGIDDDLSTGSSPSSDDEAKDAAIKAAL